MSRRIVLLVVLALGAVAMLPAHVSQTPASGVTAIRFQRVWDGTRVIANALVVVEGNRIKSVESGGRAPRGATDIDLSGYTAVPGFIDVHTHMTYYWDGAPDTTPLNQPRRDSADVVRLAEANAKRTLETGVTTVRDLGASGGRDIAMRDQINAGTMAGPRMFVAGQGISAGRGAGPNPDAMRQTTEQRLTTTADWVKVYASRGSYQSVDTTQTLTFDEMKAAVDAGHANNRPVAIHSLSLIHI